MPDGDLKLNNPGISPKDNWFIQRVTVENNAAKTICERWGVEELVDVGAEDK